MCIFVKSLYSFFVCTDFDSTNFVCTNFVAHLRSPFGVGIRTHTKTKVRIVCEITILFSDFLTSKKSFYGTPQQKGCKTGR